MSWTKAVFGDELYAVTKPMTWILLRRIFLYQGNAYPSDIRYSLQSALVNN